MYRNENNVYINRIQLNIHELIQNIELIEDKENIRLFNCSDNQIDGKLYDIPFPNLKKLYIQNNHISSIEKELPQTVEYLCIDNNQFTQLPFLSQHIKYVSSIGNPILKLPVFPYSLKKLKINMDIDMKQQSYECKKSIIVLLNKRKFHHNFSCIQLSDLQQFKSSEGDYVHFAESIMYNKDNLCIQNILNTKIHVLRFLFIYICSFL
jgi:Leucine-rich repeat (LRR) protein